MQLLNSMPEHLPIAELTSKIDILSSRLQFLGAGVTEEDKVAVLLKGLEKEYDTIVQLIQMQDIQSISYSVVVEKLKDFTVKHPNEGRIAEEG